MGGPLAEPGQAFESRTCVLLPAPEGGMRTTGRVWNAWLAVVTSCGAGGPHSLPWAFGWAHTAHCIPGQGLQPQTPPEEGACVEVGRRLERGWPHRRLSEHRGLVLTVGRAGLASVPPCPERSGPRASGTGRTRPWRHRAPTACRSPGLCPASVRTCYLAKLLSGSCPTRGSSL